MGGIVTVTSRASGTQVIIMIGTIGRIAVDVGMIPRVDERMAVLHIRAVPRFGIGGAGYKGLQAFVGGGIGPYIEFIKIKDLSHSFN